MTDLMEINPGKIFRRALEDIKLRGLCKGGAGSISGAKCAAGVIAWAVTGDPDKMWCYPDNYRTDEIKPYLDLFNSESRYDNQSTTEFHPENYVSEYAYDYAKTVATTYLFNDHTPTTEVIAVFERLVEKYPEEGRNSGQEEIRTVSIDTPISPASTDYR